VASAGGSTLHTEHSARYYGWVIVALSFVLMTASYSLLYAYSVFIPFLVEDLHLTRAEVSAPFSLCVVVYSVTSLITGRLTDRLGPRRIILLAGGLMGAGFVVLGLARNSLHLFLGCSLLYGLGMSGAFIPMSATIVRWFVAKRGLALALANLGGSAAIALGPLLGALSISAFGWRTGFMAIGLLFDGLFALSGLGMRRDPGEFRLGHTAMAMELEPSFTLPQARRTAAFWIMCALFLGTWSVMFFPFAHFVSLAIDLGWGSEGGVRLLTITGIGGLFGRFAIGAVSDRIGRKAGLVALLVVQVISCLIFAGSTSPWLLNLAAALFGIGSGASVALYAAVVGDTFGRAHVGAIAGFAFAFTCSGGGLGPLVAGWIRDQTGSYDEAFLLGAAINGLAILFAIILRRPTPRTPVTLPA